MGPHKAAEDLFSVSPCLDSSEEGGKNGLSVLVYTGGFRGVF